jgi:hypothetical protein
MKNIHILQTEKPSRLFKDDFGKYFVSINIDQEQNHFKPQNIYITNLEEIKDCWVLNTHTNVVYFLKGYYGIQPIAKKIILTNDKKLIADGVQELPEDFYSWFVNNPSCESVSIEEEDYSQKCRECGETVKRGYNCAKGCFMKSGNFIPTDKNINYKIIIPQEEPKQELERGITITHVGKQEQYYEETFKQD